MTETISSAIHNLEPPVWEFVEQTVKVFLLMRHTAENAGYSIDTGLSDFSIYDAVINKVQRFICQNPRIFCPIYR